MKIRISRRLVDAYDAFHAWGYKPIYQISKFTIRRIDPIILILLLVSTVWGYWKGGWALAAVNALTFMLVGMVCLWML